MFANLLPGFRNVRTPLATGSLYLVLIWLWIGRPAPATATGAFAIGLEWLGLLGATTLLAAASVLAYLIGSVFTIEPIVSRSNPTRAVSRCWRFNVSFDIRHIYDTTEQELTRLTRSRTDRALAAGVPVEKYREYVFAQTAGDNPVAKYGKWLNHRCVMRKCRPRTPDGRRSEEWIALEDATIGRLFADVPILSVQLHANQKDLYDDFDRALAEAGFRVSVMIPVALIAFTVALDGSVPPLWRSVALVTGVVAFYALFIRGATKVRNANDIIVQAMMLGIVQSPFLAHLDAFHLAPADADQKRRTCGTAPGPAG